MTRILLALAVVCAGIAAVRAQGPAAVRETAVLKASNAEAYDHFGEGGALPGHTGNTVALSRDGSTIAVGAPHEASGAAGINPSQSDDSTMNAGAVYVYTRSGNSWTQQAYLKPSNPQRNAHFGTVVALSENGDTLAVGVYDESGNGRTVNAPVNRDRGGSGAVYIWTRAGHAWTKQAYLKTWNAEGGDSWGSVVSLSSDGHTLAVGSLDEDCLCAGVHTNPEIGIGDQKADLSSGGAAVFVRNGTAWSQQAYLKASNPGQDDWFGVRLALSGDGNSLVVAAPNEDSNGRGVNAAVNDGGAESGAAYLFVRAGSAWKQAAYIKAANADQYDEFGTSVAFSRDGRTFVVGARGEDSGPKGGPADNSVDEAGAVYVFTR